MASTLYRLLLVCSFLSCVIVADPDRKLPSWTHLQDVRECATDTHEITPTVMVALLARNAEALLPYTFGFLEAMLYPKTKMVVWIRSDHNEDRTIDVVKEWVDNASPLYHDIDLKYTPKPTTFTDSDGPMAWSYDRLSNVALLRQQALEDARRRRIDYLLYVDADNMLVNPCMIHDLINERKAIIAPMLVTTSSYSNFWGAVDENGYYKRADDYFPTLLLERVGCFPVPVVHSTFMIDLTNPVSNSLAFHPRPIRYTGTIDDVLIFAFTASSIALPMHILNKDVYGYLTPPLTDSSTLAEFIKQFTYLKLEAMVEGPPHSPPFIRTTKVSPTRLDQIVPDKLGMDEIYLINLEKRSDRKDRMLASLEELRVDTKLVPAVHGDDLDMEYLEREGIREMPSFQDPHSKRTMTWGEIGCFMSHYGLWQEIVDRNLNISLILEDDLRFEFDFRTRFQEIQQELKKLELDWDLLYIGRKILSTDEKLVPGSSKIAMPSYTYWTLGYMITLNGAQKLIDAEPLSKLVPVDEYIPIMFNKHPRADWNMFYDQRDLKAFTVHPLLVYPTHYTGETNYFSDTETSYIIKSDMSQSRVEL